jgi:perosamine synthetase
VTTSFHQLAVDFIRTIYGEGPIPLHRPVFEGREKQNLLDCIDSNFVSSVGELVTDFEERTAEYTGADFSVATANGTSALQVALHLLGVRQDDEVITQALTFVAICNAISYTGARPVFVDVARETMGMNPDALRRFLMEHAVMREGEAFNKTTGKRLAACTPMHTFGNPCQIEEIIGICEEFNIPVIEDAAESLGSFVEKRHTGTFGRIGVLSFNGNKVITTGGGGMILTDDAELARRAKHVTTTAKIPHPYEFSHDEIGYNYRLPNLNAALGCAQMERLPEFLAVKADIAWQYQSFFEPFGIAMLTPRQGTTPNHWLNAIVLKDLNERNLFLDFTNQNDVMTRPIWKLMSQLPMFSDCQHDGLNESQWLADRVVNVPSSVPDGALSDFNFL